MFFVVKLAAVQFASSASSEENVSRASKLVEKASKAGAKLVCLPEYFYSSRPLREIVSKSAVISELVAERMYLLARKLGVFVIYSIPKNNSGKVTNTSVVVSRNGELGEYSKTCLFPNKPFNEKDYFAAGRSAPVFDCGFAKIGIAICYDFRFPEIFRKLAFGGADIIFVPSAFPMDKLIQWRTLLAARAIENQLFVAGVNKTSRDSKSEYAANTMFISPRGQVISEAKGRGEQLVFAEVRLSEMTALRKKVNYLKSAGIFY